MLNDFLKAPGVVGAGHRGDLDGHVVHILARHEAGYLSQAMRRFLLTEDGLAEEVDVQAVTALAQAGERGAETLVGRIDDEVADDLTEHSTRSGCHHTRSEERGGRAKPHRRSQSRGQEVLTAGRQALHGRTGDVQVSGTHDIIDESGGKGQPVRIGEDTGQELGRLGRGLMGRLVGPAAGTDDRPLPQRPQVIGAASSVGMRAGNDCVRHA